MKFDDPTYRERFWHTASHIMAHAVKELFPQAKLAIGPAIAHGFYYDFDTPQPFTPEDLDAIDAKMKEIVKADLPLVQEVWPREKARAFFQERDETYKVELIDSLPEKEEVSVFIQGDFIDLCKGPHLENTGLVKAFALLSTAGAYWHGDEKNPMLQRIYGTAYPDKKQLKAALKKLEEAKKRDHRTLGADLDLFSFQEEVGPGLVLWHPKGGTIRNEIETYWRQEHYKAGYEIIYTPHIGKAQLWETSGHLGFYNENMYSPIIVDEQEYFAKPMNCPFHILIYNNALRSYRDLPMRWAELGTVYRYERSGVLHGLLRVRGFTQDDAHIICRPDQMEDELDRVLGFCLDILNAFGFDDFHVYVSTRPEGKCVGEEERWEAAQTALEKVVAGRNLEFDIDEGGGAFYGPKIDIKIRDALDREWQCSTIQFDFNIPERFNMTYIGEDGAEHRPYMIHRALLGAIERFFAVLLEHTAGKFPLWLAPEHIRIVPIKDTHLEYAQEVCDALRTRNIRAEIDDTSRPMGAKIRDARNDRLPYIAVVGEEEKDNRTVALRVRDTDSQKHGVSLTDLVQGICEERDLRSLSSYWS